MKIARATRASLGLATLVTLIIASTIRAQARKSALDVPQTQQQNSLLYDLLPKNDEEHHTAALEEIGQRGDKSYIAPLIDLLLFFTSPDDSAAILNTLDQLTGQNWDGSADPWDQLCVWYAE